MTCQAERTRADGASMTGTTTDRCTLTGDHAEHQDHSNVDTTGEIWCWSSCGWFLQCEAASVATVEHPTVGDVPICQRHLDWLTEDLGPLGQPNPTKMVPPMVAASARRHGIDGLVTA